MIKKNPETYNEIVLVKNILELTKYYNVSQTFIDDAYDFLITDKKNVISCNDETITFRDDMGTAVKEYYASQTIENRLGTITLTSTSINIVNRPGYSSSNNYNY